MFLPRWTYDGTDPGLRLFTLANPLLPSVPTGSEVFEIGSADTDFLARVHEADRSLVVAGIDWRACKDNRVIQGDVLKAKFGHDRFSAVCSLSAIEHVGLGRYKDPISPAGDIEAIWHVKDWLTREGWCYFDVPYTPEGYQVFSGNKCRCYDDAALQQRFGKHDVLGYADLDVSGWIEKPTKNRDAQRPFYYVAILVRKGEA